MIVRGAVLAFLLTAAAPVAPTPDVHGPANQAFADRQATSSVLAQGKTAIEALYSYSWRDLDAWRTSVRDWATGSAATQLTNVVERNAAQVTQRQAVVTTKVAELGLSELRGDTAVLLAYINSSSSQLGSAPVASGGSLVVTVHRGPQKWLVTDLKVAQ